MRKLKLRRIFLGLLSLFLVLFLGSAFYRFNHNRSSAFRTRGDRFQIYHNGNWHDFTVKGINMGSAKPGCFPGQMAITKKEYARWFKQISAMNADVIRVYTILSPQFYQAFFEHNLFAKNPIYLLQGVWVDDNNITLDQNAYNETLCSDFYGEIEKIVDVLHGKAVIKARPGHAFGTYRYNVSPYVMGYILVEEMDAEFVISTNEKNAGVTGYDGDYLYTKDASPYEAWLAAVGDYTISYEQKKYGGPQKPMSWTNWVTTDPMEHSNEPDKRAEDAVGVDFEHIFARDNFYAGIFASYHIYPYYPDFLRYQPEYISYLDDRGKFNPFEAYLLDLKKHHTMPVLVAEFGVPTSRGVNHKNQVLPFNQGNNTEKEQGAALADMFDSIVKTGYAGGLIFAWHDEWFKKAWNTMDMDLPDHRPHWPNYQTSEESFGLLTFDPGKEKVICHVDGDISEWKKKKPVSAGNGLELFVMSDEKYVYLMLKDSTGDVEKDRYYIAVDCVPGLGSQKYIDGGVTFKRQADMLIILDGRERSTVLVEASEDTYYRMYAVDVKIIPRDPRMEVKNSGLFNPWRLILSNQLYLPLTKETIPVEYIDTGKLQCGNSNPDLPDYSNLADFCISPKNRAIELRIPWMLFNAADPSTKTFIGDLYKSAYFDMNPVKTDGIYFESLRSGSQISAEPGFYTWKEWGDSPLYHERLKESYHMVKAKFGEYNYAH